MVPMNLDDAADITLWVAIAALGALLVLTAIVAGGA